MCKNAAQIPTERREPRDSQQKDLLNGIQNLLARKHRNPLPVCPHREPVR